MPGGLVAVNDALARHRVDDGRRRLECGRSVGLVAGTDRLDDLADGAAHFRALRDVLRAACERLVGPFFG